MLSHQEAPFVKLTTEVTEYEGHGQGLGWWHVIIAIANLPTPVYVHSKIFQEWLRHEGIKFS
jgi:hypothetical protein